VEVAEGHWDQPSRLVLESDESVWYRSWVRPSFTAASLDQVLSSTTSYGFSFVGFATEPTGKLSMSSFQIRST
jgi:hypothetical protein